MKLSIREKRVLLHEIHAADKKYREVKGDIKEIKEILNWAFDYKDNYKDGWECAFDSLYEKAFKQINCNTDI